MYGLKLIAIISMFIDHLCYAVTFSPEVSLYFHNIGRLAIPAFSIMMVYNYIHHTSHKRNYIIRLSILGLTSEPFFHLFFNASNVNAYLFINPLLTLACAMALIHIATRPKDFIDHPIFAGLSILMILSCIAAQSLNPTVIIKSQFWWIIFIIVGYIMVKIKDHPLSNKFIRQIVMIALLCMVSQTFYDYLIGISLAIIVIDYVVFQGKSICPVEFSDISKNINPMIYYWFYPFHLGFLYILTFIM